MAIVAAPDAAIARTTGRESSTVEDRMDAAGSMIPASPTTSAAQDGSEVVVGSHTLILHPMSASSAFALAVPPWSSVKAPSKENP